uniref:Uncharacterized protein n=1 Tax=Anguilla anguilla TaxID=7936 RepID=A0A0E9XGC3_ANGAN
MSILSLSCLLFFETSLRVWYQSLISVSLVPFFLPWFVKSCFWFLEPVLWLDRFVLQDLVANASCSISFSFSIISRFWFSDTPHHYNKYKFCLRQNDRKTKM